MQPTMTANGKEKDAEMTAAANGLLQEDAIVSPPVKPKGKLTAERISAEQFSRKR